MSGASEVKGIHIPGRSVEEVRAELAAGGRGRKSQAGKGITIALTLDHPRP